MAQMLALLRSRDAAGRAENQSGRRCLMDARQLVEARKPPSRAAIFRGRYPMRTNVFGALGPDDSRTTMVGPFEMTAPKLLKKLTTRAQPCT